MKKIRKIMAIILSLILMFTFIPISSGYIEVKATNTFRITAPKANQLIAAGYFDIEWTAADIGTVENYQIYIDNKIVGTTKETSFEYYTTKVKAFSLYILANYTDGWSERTSTITFGVSKKGLGLATDMGANLDTKAMGISWYYNWGTAPSSGNQYKGIEFVPMQWGNDSYNNINNKMNNWSKQGYKYALAFNEPDLNGQGVTSVDDAVNRWPAFQNHGIRVGSPASYLWPSASNWLKEFMVEINNNVDFITIHCYPDNFGGAAMAEWFLTEVVDKAWEMYHKPIWITEFSTTGESITATGENGTKEFWENVMPGLDERAYVERYAAFGFNNSQTGLWDYSTGKLTPGGEVYSNLGNPADFTPATEEEEYLGYTVSEKRKGDLLQDTVTVNGVTCQDYTKLGNVSVTASSGQNSAKYAIDENIGTRWESEHGVDPQYLLVDLGSVKNIKQLDIIWEDASAGSYTVEISDDGQNYSEAASISGGSGGNHRNDTIVFKQMVSGRYVKINGTSRTTAYGYSIFDMAIYGSDDTKANDETTTAPETTTPPIVNDESEDNLLAGVEWNTTIDEERVGCEGTLIEENGIIKGSFVTTGGGNQDAIDGIKAEVKDVALEIDNTYKYSADILATKDMTIYIILTNGDGNVIARERIGLSAGEAYTYTKQFAAVSDKVDISYLLCAGNEGAVENVELAIYKNSLKPYNYESEEVTEKVTEKATEKVTKEETTAKVAETTKEATTSPKIERSKITLKKTKVKKATKKRTSKKIKFTLKRIKGAQKYQIQISKKKKFSKKNILIKKTVKKVKTTINKKKLANKRKLYIRARAIKVVNGVKYYGKWSNKKRVTIK